MTSPPPKAIGFIGLGLMGTPMAQNLIDKTSSDTTLYVYDVSPSAVTDFTTKNTSKAKACPSSREVARKSQIVFSMVPEGKHVRSVYLADEDGVLAAAREDLDGKLLIDCSTIDTGTSFQVRDACAQQHPRTRFVDAPVSGGVVGAERGTLTFMVGVSEEEDEEVLGVLRPLLEMMGGNIFPCGGFSLGLTAKLCNNYCSGLIAIAVSEAMNIGMASGMDPRVLGNVFHTSTAQSAICDDWCPVPGLSPGAPASNGYKGGFRVGLMKKDFGLAVDSARRVGVKLALGEEGLKVYEGATGDDRCKDLDSRVVYRYLGGKEDWREKHPGDVAMVKEKTKEALKRGRELQ